MLQIKNLHKSYKSFKVLDGLYMNINGGDVYGFLGKNGCGKTTTMNIICNIIPKDEGEIIMGNNGEERIRIGYLPETPSLYEYMNGYEYLGYIAYAAKYKGDVNKRISDVLAITGMTEGAKRRIKGYSRGMNQRLGIAAAIFNDPQLLVLDEPTSALDPEGRAEVMGIIKNLSAQGCTIILCTHILADVERVSNRIGILSRGKLAEEGSINEIVEKYRSDSVEIALSGSEEDRVRALETFRQSGFASSVDYFGSSGLAVINVPDADEGMAATIRCIAENNIGIYSIRTARPTLEQVYLDIVGGAGQ